jgi:hypothetical protein
MRRPPAAARRGRRVRASSLPDCPVIWLVKTAHEPPDIGRDPTPPHDDGPEVKGRRRDERPGESNRRQIVMEMRPPAAVQRVT